MFDVVAHPLDDEQIARGLTPHGTLPLCYQDLLAFAEIARARNWVLQSFTAREIIDGDGYMRMDATGRLPHDEYGDEWSGAVHDSIEFMRLVLADVEDRQELIYEVWVDDGRPDSAGETGNHESP